MELGPIVVLLGLAATLLLAYFFFGSFVLGAGYQPTPAEVAERMMVLGAVGPGDRVYDLGAGTGALLFRSVRRGAEVTGFEAEPLRFLILKLRRVFQPAKERVTILRTNLFDANLRPATVILAFLWPGAMARLRPKLESELAPGTRVVSYWHPIPGWEPSQVDRRLKVYLYIR